MIFYELLNIYSILILIALSLLVIEVAMRVGRVYYEWRLAKKKYEHFEKHKNEPILEQCE